MDSLNQLIIEGVVKEKPILEKTLKGSQYSFFISVKTKNITEDFKLVLYLQNGKWYR